MTYFDGLKILLVHHITNLEVFEFTKPISAYHDLTIVLDGKMKYNISKKSIALGKGDAIYCPNNTQLYRPKGKKASYISINFTITSKEPLPLNYFIPNILSDEIQAYIDIITQLLKKPGASTEAKLENIVKALLIEITESQGTDPLLPYADRIKKYIHDNFRNPITLETVSQYINLNPSYCSTLFKQLEGKTVTEYINFMRIQYAKELLTLSQLKIGEIGAHCGIPDPYYFSRVFNKICGMPPSQYRKIAKIYSNDSLQHKANEEETNAETKSFIALS